MLDEIARNGNEFDGMGDYGARLVVGALLTAMAISTRTGRGFSSPSTRCCP